MKPGKPKRYKLPPEADKIRIKIETGMVVNQINFPELANVSGIPYQTLKKRFNKNHPESFLGLTVGEYASIAKVLGIE